MCQTIVLWPVKLINFILLEIYATQTVNIKFLEAQTQSHKLTQSAGIIENTAIRLENVFPHVSDTRANQEETRETPGRANSSIRFCWSA
ncbi:hypothetical protein PoB_004279500 [Plakobranchus ocellatus]|uniref:Secreted protein n=1 Tax=Plakobranchus ocellatus TaxID=259542 RepID=A0AAV4BB18_9GAST|nr:hypothetical protein PoB_004279500 [Plakobranchus ocellatus]